MMKKLFYFGILGLLLFEAANLYFILPVPGSQEMNSIDLAYFLHTWRWVFRLAFVAMIATGFRKAFQGSKILPSLCVLISLGVVYLTNFNISADTMFLQSGNLQMRPAVENKVDKSRLVIGVEYQGQAKAYPIQYLGYHHQVLDTISGKPLMVTYCNVCRTGRVFEPVIHGKQESFRLVGMDHFNAMFEDKTTKSWWRQATGEAVAGKLKGQVLPEFSSSQMTLSQWLSIYPNSLIMQADQYFQVEYDHLSDYEAGRHEGKLTRRDSLSWQDKSWVVGVSIGKESKAYDWNALEKARIIYDVLDNRPFAVILADDNNSFAVLELPDQNQKLQLKQDTLMLGQNRYNLLGGSLDPAIPGLKKLNAYQEYWHSWLTFHPSTQK
ncbi:MAG: DUF3179 domain-containing (seleno)protein [Saprospiraceae bacterium]|nr:DUF3179 domain-containing (seleno)protein [Saprospiraceae bacterium]MDZ4703439.1 DUF3179 domain-containing (seleno)protein [Saprospiraceae bacterium]